MSEQSVLEVTLTIMSGPDDGRRIRYAYEDGDGELDADGVWIVSMGRRDDCDLCLPFDTQISRLHAHLKVEYSGASTLIDLDSRNGTYLGKNRINTPVPVEIGVMFRIGRTWVRLDE